MVAVTASTDKTKPQQPDPVFLMVDGLLGAPDGTVALDALDMDKQALEYEIFLNEVVEVRIPKSDNENELNVATPSVNGTVQPIVRGVWAPVKRKYVEALANAKTTRYKQVVGPAGPDDIKWVAEVVHSFPFEVRDPNVKGQRWLDHLMAQPA